MAVVTRPPVRATLTPPTRLARRPARRRLGTLAQYVLLAALALLSFAQILLMVSLSLRPGVLIYVDFWRLVNWPPYLDNYRTALLSLLPSMWRTLWVSGVSIAGILVVSTIASYAFARIRFPGRDVLYHVVLAVMTIPAIILLTPHFILANQLHLTRSLWGLVVFYVAGGLPFGIFLITTFFRAQPVEMFEAARVDGASELQAMFRIAVPLAFPILVTVAIMNFLAIYGDFIWPTLVLSKDNDTLLMALQAFNPQVGEYANRPDFGVQAAGYVFATLPQLVVFALGMKYFVAGVTSGAIKA